MIPILVKIPVPGKYGQFQYVPVDDTKPAYNKLTEVLVQAYEERDGHLTRVYKVENAQHWLANIIDFFTPEKDEE